MTEYNVIQNHESIDVSGWSYKITMDSTNQCYGCKNELQHTGGYVSCLNCGFSKCD